MLFSDYANQYTIPKNKTLFELQAELGTVPVRNNDYIRLNAARLGSIGSWSDDDLNIFWICMDVYAATGKNYFANYFNLIYRLADEIWDFSNGIESWFYTSHWGDYGTADEFIELVDYLRFFNIDYYDDIPFSEFEKYAHMASSLYKSAEEQRRKSEELTRVESVNAAIERFGS